MACLQASRRGELRPPELPRKFRELLTKNQRVLSDLHAWAVRTISSVYGKNRLLNCVDTLVFITGTIVMWKDNRVESINPPNTD